MHKPGVHLDMSTPVILLGGRENALSATRTFGRLGARVMVVGYKGDFALRSRYCSRGHEISPDDCFDQACRAQLLENSDTAWSGSVVFPCSDEAIEFVANYDAALRERYILEPATPRQRLLFLDKRATLKLAAEAGIPAPKYWDISTPSDIENLPEDIVFPVLVKPVNSAAFTAIFKQKLFIVHDDETLKEKAVLALAHQLDVMIVEMIPGPDTLLSSYYTYITSSGERLYDFTKKIIRRHPENQGAACCHETEELPATAKQGLKFFEFAKLRGMGNIEFKKDERDGQLKIIEVNARFTAALEHAARAEAPLDLIAYAYLTNQRPPEIKSVRNGIRYWYPLRDFAAARRLRKAGRLSWIGWLSDVLPKKSVNPYFAWDDLGPVQMTLSNVFRRLLKR